MNERKIMMKKLVLIVLTLIMALSLCACGGGDTETTKDGGATNPPSDDISLTPKGYLFTDNGVQFGVDMAVADVLVKLGEPKDQYTSESCAFGGQDTVYYYNGFQISTNDEEGYERIYSVYLESDLVATEEGICIGDSADKVQSVYGTPGEGSTEANLVYAKDGMTLSFNIKDGAVSSILYNDPA